MNKTAKKTITIFFILSIFLNFILCKHKPVKKTEKVPEISQKEKGEKLPDKDSDEITIDDDISDWVSPINIDYREYERNAPLRLVVQSGHSDYIRDLAVSPDGKLVATASDDGSIMIWSIDCVLLKKIPVPDLIPNRILFTPDGRRIAASFRENTVKVWEIDGKPVKTYKGKDYNVRVMDISRDGKRIITSSGRRGIAIRNSNWKILKKIGTANRIYALAISPDGKLFASGGSYYRTGSGWLSSSSLRDINGKFIKGLDVVIPGKIGVRKGRDKKEKPTGDVKWITFSPDGKLIASIGEKHILNIRNTEGRLLRQIKFTFVKRCHFIYNSKELIVSASRDTKIFAVTGRERSYFKMPTQVSCSGITPDGRKIVTGTGSSGKDNFTIWNRRGDIINSSGTNSEEVHRTLLSPDFNRIILEPDKRGRKIFIWDVKDRVIKESEERIGYYSDGGEYRFYYGRGNVFHISGAMGTGSFKTRHGTGILPLADGRIAKWHPFSGPVTVQRGAVIIYDINGNPLRKILFKHRRASGIGGPFPYGTAFSPDGSYFIIETDTYNGRIHTVSLIGMNGKLIKKINTGTGLETACISNDGMFIATGHENGLIQVWTRKGKLVKKLRGHLIRINKMNFTIDGRYLVSSSKDRTMKIWNIKTGKYITLLFYENGDWIVYDDMNNFDASEGGRRYISFVKGLTVYDFQKMERIYYKPGLIARFFKKK